MSVPNTDLHEIKDLDEFVTTGMQRMLPQIPASLVNTFLDKFCRLVFSNWVLVDNSLTQATRSVYTRPPYMDTLTFDRKKNEYVREDDTLVHSLYSKPTLKQQIQHRLHLTSQI
jgi:hypothetical protein